MAHPGRIQTTITAEVLSVAFGYRPFSRAQAEATGITRGRLRAACHRGLVSRLSRDVYCLAVTASPEDLLLLRVRHAVAGMEGARMAVGGRAGAELHGLPFVRPRSSNDGRHGVEVLMQADDAARYGRLVRGTIIRPVASLPEDLTEIEGIPVTSLLHTAIDVVRLGIRPTHRVRPQALPLPEALVVLDAATRMAGARSSADGASLVSAMRARFWHCSGIRSVDRAVEFIDPLAESPLESWSRGHMIVHGLPMPLTQQVVTGADGRDYRVDFCWPELRVIGEADGMAKYGETPFELHEAKRRELSRQRALEEAGWIIVRWTWDELARDPLAVIQRILNALRAAA